MRHQKISNSLNEENDSKFSDNSKASYNAANEITFKIKI